MEYGGVKEVKVCEDTGPEKEAENGQGRLKVGNKWNSSGIGRGEMRELSSQENCVLSYEFPTVGNETFPSDS